MSSREILKDIENQDYHIGQYYELKIGEIMDWIYIFGERKWYYNWVILIVTLGVCPLVFCYAIYKIWKDLGLFG